MSDVYRRMTMTPDPKPAYVQINPSVQLRRDWIKSVDEDGTVHRVDGLTEQGDPERLREEGLL